MSSDHLYSLAILSNPSLLASKGQQCQTIVTTMLLKVLQLSSDHLHGVIGWAVPCRPARIGCGGLAIQQCVTFTLQMSAVNLVSHNPVITSMVWKSC